MRAVSPAERSVGFPQACYTLGVSAIRVQGRPARLTMTARHLQQRREICSFVRLFRSMPDGCRCGGRESSTRCNFRKHMQIEKAPANQENIFISLTADGANAHNTNK